MRNIKAREWLWKIRQERKLQIVKIAEELGISATYYCQIERGQKTPTPKTSKRIAKILGIEWTKFYN